MTYVTVPFVNEHESGHYWPNGVYDGPADDDCVFCSGLMQFLAHKPGDAPATLYEAERIRQAAGLGPDGPANSDNLIAGMKARYLWAPVKIQPGFTELWAKLVPGMSATASGHVSNFGLGHRLRRFLPTFTGGHRIFVQRLGPEDRVWWMDPEGSAGYTGEWATKAELALFVKGGSSHTIASIAEEGEPVVTVVDATPKQVATTPGAIYYDLNGAKVTTSVEPITRLSPYAIRLGWGIGRVVVVGSSTFQLMVVKPGDPHVVVTDLPPPDLEAAVLAAKRAQYDAVVAALGARP